MLSYPILCVSIQMQFLLAIFFLTGFRTRGSPTDKLFLCCTFEAWKLKALLKYKRSSKRRCLLQLFEDIGLSVKGRSSRSY